MNAVDTNILIYVQDPADPVKQRIARDLVNSMRHGILLWQVACEYIAACRKLTKSGYSIDQGFKDLEEFRQLWVVATPDTDVLLGAQELLGRFSLSFWDALLVSACRKAGVTQLYSEDICSYPAIDSVKLTNPFAASPSP